MNSGHFSTRHGVYRLRFRVVLIFATTLMITALVGCKPPPPPPKKTSAPPKKVQFEPERAIAQGDVEALRQALIAEPDLPTKRYDGNQTLLHKLAWTSHTNLVNLLLLAGANIDAKDSAGMTPLITAILRKQHVMAAYLVERGSDLKLTSPKGRNAFHTAALVQAEPEMLKMLLDRGIDIEATDFTGMTALHMAAQQGDDVLVEFLIQRGASITKRTPEGLTATEIARQIGKIQVLALLTAKEKELAALTAVPEVKPVETNIVAVVTQPKTNMLFVPPPPKIMHRQVSIVVDTIKGQDIATVRNTGMGAVEVEVVWKYLYEDDSIRKTTTRVYLDPMQRREVRPFGTYDPNSPYDPRNPDYIDPRSAAGRASRTNRTSAAIFHGKQLGYAIDILIDGKVNNTYAQPPMIAQKIERIEKRPLR